MSGRPPASCCVYFQSPQEVLEGESSDGDHVGCLHVEGGGTFLDSLLEVTRCLLLGVSLLLAPLLPCLTHKGTSHPRGVEPLVAVFTLGSLQALQEGLQMPGAAPGALWFLRGSGVGSCGSLSVGGSLQVKKKRGGHVQFIFITWRGCPVPLAAQRAG